MSDSSDSESLTEDENNFDEVTGDEADAAKSILSLSSHSAALKDDLCIICRLITRQGTMIRAKLSVQLKTYVMLKGIDYERMDNPALLCGVKCYKAFENWKKTSAGKMAVKVLEVTLAKEQNQELHLEERDDGGTSRKKRKGSFAVSVKGKENVEDVMIRVALHSPTDRKGISEMIKCTQISLPQSIASLSDLRHHLEVELESWDPYEWAEGIKFQAGTKKSDQTVMDIINFASYTSIVHSIVQQKRSPVLVLKQQKASGKEANNHRSGSTLPQSRNSQPQEQLHTVQALQASLAGHCSVNPLGCFHKSFDGNIKHLKICQRLVGIWGQQLNAKTPGVSFTSPPNLSPFDACNFKHARETSQILDNIPSIPLSSYERNQQKQQWQQSASNNTIQTPSPHNPSTFYSTPLLQPLSATNASQANQLTNRAPSQQTTPLQGAPFQTPPLQSSPVWSTHNLQPENPPSQLRGSNTIRFFRVADGSFIPLTGRISYRNDDTISSLMQRANLPVTKPGKFITAWDKHKDDIQVLLSDVIAEGFPGGDAEVVIKAVDQEIEY